MKRGFTLTEAIIASFLLISAMLVVAQLFHASLRYGVWSENKALATYLAEKRVAELRRWAAVQDDDWANPPMGNDPDFPIFNVDVRLDQDTLASPCRMLMEGRAQPRLFQESLRRATVDVSWGSGANKVSMSTLLRDARRGWRETNPIVISGGSSTVAAGEPAVFTAIGHSPNGPILDLRFSWSVEPAYPGGATGTLIPSVDGFSVTFRNELMTGTGPVVSTGTCRIYATAVYAGEERRGSSNVINLVP